MQETSRRTERGQRNGSGSFGHGRNPDRSPLRRRSSFQALPESADDLPPLPDEFWRTLDAGLKTISLPLSMAERRAIDSHVRLLVAWNVAINLTALRDPEQLARNHVLDSLAALEVLRGGAHETLIDIGSGPGFPGLPLALVLPVSRAALVDSIGKKARFLEAAANAATAALRESRDGPPDVSALPERAEDLADEPDHREAWDLVTARAVGSVAEVAEIGLPLARQGGSVAIWKRETGDGTLQDEIAAAGRIVQATGGGAPRVAHLPFAEELGLYGHCLVIIEKRRPTPDRYPRPAGERRRALP